MRAQLKCTKYNEYNGYFRPTKSGNDKIQVMDKGKYLKH